MNEKTRMAILHALSICVERYIAPPTPGTSRLGSLLFSAIYVVLYFIFSIKIFRKLDILFIRYNWIPKKPKNKVKYH